MKRYKKIRFVAATLGSTLTLVGCGGGGTNPVNLTQVTPLAAIASAATVNLNSTATLSTIGGSGGGAVSYQVSSGPCTVSGSTLTASSTTGTCIVKATKAGDGLYTSSSAEVTVNVALILSTGFADGSSSGHTVEGGTWSTYGGSGGTSPQVGIGSGSGTVSSTVAPAQSYVYEYITTANPAATFGSGFYAYDGISITAPAAGDINLNGMNYITFTANTNQQFMSSTNGQYALAKLTFTGTAGGSPCTTVLEKVFQLTTASNQTYTLPLSSFVVSSYFYYPPPNYYQTSENGCGLTNPATAFSTLKLHQFDIQTDGGGSARTDGTFTTTINTNQIDSYGGYPTTLGLVGGVTFIQ